MHTRIILTVFIVAALSCKQIKNKQPANNEAIPVFTPKSDTSNSHLYDFLKVAIAKQHLDSSYGLVIIPFSNPGMESDSVYLNTLLVDSGQRFHQLVKPKKGGWITVGKIDKCLTREDVEVMLQQKEDYRTFRWNLSQLPFSGTNKYQEKYVFSIPLFSKDRKKVLISYENVMGTGRIILFEKQNDQWLTQIGPK